MSGPACTVVHLTTVHPRFDNRIFGKEIPAVAAAGFDVTAVVADGQGDNIVNGIRFVDVGRAGNRLLRMTLLPLRAFGAVRKLKPDLVHFHDPELAPVGYLLRLCGIKAIYDAHEDLPRALASRRYLKPWLKRIVATCAEIIEDFCARRMSAIVTATPHIARRFARLNRIVVDVNNYPDLQKVPAFERRPEPRTFCYVGIISRPRSIFEMMEAARIADCRLLIAGRFGDPEFERTVKAHPNWKNVTFLGMLPHSGIWDVMNRSIAGLLFFHPEPNHVNALPNKLFEYMAGGLAILCSDFPDWIELAVKQGAGLAADPLDAHSIAAQMALLIENPELAETMGRRGHDIVNGRYSWESEAGKLVTLYRELLR
jgi:glycosyltransferase involved in cell wall biosynthesis